MTRVIRYFGQSSQWRWSAGITRSAATCVISWVVVLALINRGQACQQDQADPNLEVSAAQIQAFVSQLGSDDFKLRELAAAELLKIGGAAIEPVRAAQASGNSEIRFRAYRLLPQLKRAAASARFRDFIQDGIAQPSEFFAMWKEFSAIVGTDQLSRELYGSVHNASPQLFDNFLHDPNIARMEYFELLNSLNRSRFRSLSAAAVLFLDTVDFDSQPALAASSDANKPPERIWTNTETLIRTGEYLRGPGAVSFIETSGYENQFRLLIENWIECLPSNDNHLLETKLSMIESYRLIDQLPAMIEMAANEDQSVQNRARAIAIVARLGGTGEISSLRPLLENDSSVGHFVGNRDQAQLLEVQLRDVALAASVYLSGQNLEDFGFVVDLHRKGNFLSLSRAGFASQEERERSFQKWQQHYQDYLQLDK